MQILIEPTGEGVKGGLNQVCQGCGDSNGLLENATPAYCILRREDFHDGHMVNSLENK